MAQENNTFNLLYKTEAQKTSVDKLYDFLIGPARMIIIGVLLVIISVFGYRFILDSTLRDERKKAAQYESQINRFVKDNENEFREIILRTEGYATYINMYREFEDEDDVDSGKLYKASNIINDIYNIKNQNYNNTITIQSYNFNRDEEATTLSINGNASTFLIVDQFVSSLRSLSSIEEASSTNLGGSRDENPKYLINIKLKK